VVEFVTQSAIEPLLRQVFEIIDQKRAMEKRRKTWNNVRREERRKEAVVRRTQWSYKEPEKTVKSKLDLLFAQDEEERGEQVYSFFRQEGGAMAASSEQLEQPQVPVKIALSQCFFQVVNDQFKTVNKCFLHMLLRKFSLMQHLESIKKIYLCY
jgi:hypothetical protein